MKKQQNTILKIENLVKQFKSKNGFFNAVDDINLEVKKGEIVGLIGESGSGKTTVSKMITRLTPVTFGEIKFNDEVISQERMSKKRLRRLYSSLQMIFQNPYSSLNGRMNLINIISEPLKVNKSIKNDVKNFFLHKEDMAKAFKKDLEIFYLKNYEKLRQKYNSLELKVVKNLTTTLNEIKDSSLDLDKKIATLQTQVFDVKIETNNELVNSLSDLIQKLDKKYEDTLQKTINKEMTNDEKDLISKQKLVDLLKENLNLSPEQIALQNELKELDNQTQTLEANLASLSQERKEAFKSIIKRAKRRGGNWTQKKSIALSAFEFNRAILEVVSHKKLIAFYRKNKDKLFLMENSAIFDFDLFLLKEIDQMIFKVTKEKQNVFLDEKNISHFDSIFNKYQLQLDNGKDIALTLVENINLNKEKIAQINAKLKTIEPTKKYLSDNALALKKAEKELEISQKEYDNELLKYNENIYNPEREEWFKQKEESDLIFHELSIALKNFYALLKTICLDLSKEILKTKGKDEMRKFINYKNEKITQDSALVYETKSFVKMIKTIYKQKFLIEEVSWNFKFKMKSNVLKVKVFKALEEVGLKASHAYRYPHEFSGGQRQRIAIARSLINNPDFIIADEPIAALDVSIQAQIVNLLVKLVREKGMSMLFIAHDLAMVKYIADRVYIMHSGKIVEQGETEAVFLKPKHPYTIRLLSSMPSLETINAPFTEIKPLENYRETYHLNSPTFAQVGKDNHYVLATKEQEKIWKIS